MFTRCLCVNVCVSYLLESIDQINDVFLMGKVPTVGEGSEEVEPRENLLILKDASFYKLFLWHGRHNDRVLL